MYNLHDARELWDKIIKLSEKISFLRLYYVKFYESKITHKMLCSGSNYSSHLQYQNSFDGCNWKLLRFVRQTDETSESCRNGYERIHPIEDIVVTEFAVRRIVR